MMQLNSGKNTQNNGTIMRKFLCKFMCMYVCIYKCMRIAKKKKNEIEREKEI